jgi:hypothetical protein
MRDTMDRANLDDHDAIQALLPEYLALAAEGGEPERAFPQVAAHLSSCARCRVAAAELAELGAIAYSGAFRREEPAPKPSEAPQPSGPGLLALARTALGELVFSFTQPLVDAWLRPRLAGAYRGQLVARDVAATAEAVPAELQLELRSIADDCYSLGLRLQLPERDPLAQGGVMVRLLGAATLHEERTDELGDVVFEGITRAELPGLNIVIVP